MVDPCVEDGHFDRAFRQVQRFVLVEADPCIRERLEDRLLVDRPLVVEADVGRERLIRLDRFDILDVTVRLERRLRLCLHLRRRFFHIDEREVIRRFPDGDALCRDVAHRVHLTD